MSMLFKACLILLAAAALPRVSYAVPQNPGGGAAPEPATMLLIGAGAGAIGIRRYISRRSKRSDKDSDRK